MPFILYLSSNHPSLLCMTVAFCYLHLLSCYLLLLHYTVIYMLNGYSLQILVSVVVSFLVCFWVFFYCVLFCFWYLFLPRHVWAQRLNY